MKKLGAILIAAALILAASAAFIALGFGTTTPTTGVIVPLYSYPGSVWTSLISDHNSYSSVPITAVINPGSSACGAPNPCPDPNYESGISSLTSAGITVIGYVYTAYGHMSLSNVEGNITEYANWYKPDGLSGILFDSLGVGGTGGNETYYTTLKNFAASDGLTLTVGGAGNAVPSGFIGILNFYVIYESSTLPSTSTLAANTGGYASSNFAMIAYGISSSSVTQSYVTSASSYVAWMYITDATLPNPYTVLPTYFSTLLSYLGPASGGGGGTTSSTTSISTSSAGTATGGTSTSNTISTTSSGTALGGGGLGGQIFTALSQNLESILVVATLVVMVAAVIIARRK